MTNLINMRITMNAEINDKHTGEVYATMTLDFYARDMEYNADMIKMIESNYKLLSRHVSENELILHYVKWVN